MKIIGTFLTVCGLMAAQAPQAANPVQQSTENAARIAAGAIPIYRVTVTQRTAKAINYRHRSGATKIDFRGTELLRTARGEAKVESKQGYTEIEVEFDGLQPATKQGSEYLTYVLWAITPEGRTANLGEILLNGTRSKLNVTTELQVFGLVATAEPYYSVTRPSDLIVMENVVRADTKGKIEEIDAKYELLQRGQYQRLANPLALKVDPKLPLELYEARNSVEIARAVGAERFATETFQKAEKSLSQAEVYQERKAGKKPVASAAAVAQDLSKYRNFQLGADLPTIAKQVGGSPSQATVVHRRPALIQDLEWRAQPLGPSSQTESVQEVVFSFYDGELFRIAITYDRYETEGLRADDFIEAISAMYGIAEIPTPPAKAVQGRYGDEEEIIARWQDSQYCFELIRSSYDPTFRLVGALKRLQAPEKAAITEAKRLDDLEAPQRDAARIADEKEVERAKLETSRLVNKPKFRP